MMIRLCKHIVVILVIAGLAACGQNDRLEALKQEIKQFKQNIKEQKASVNANNFHIPEPIYYAADSSSQSNSAATSRNKPKSENPLQNYPLKSLQFIGTLSEHNQIWAFIMTPDKMVYKAKDGDTIGDDNGKIVKIESDQIQVTETYVENGKSQGRVVTLQLKE